MDRTQLEDRIRTSLHDRADDVEPTPALWDRVARRTTRRRRIERAVWSLGGAAAVVAVALAAAALLQSSPGISIDPDPIAPSTNRPVLGPTSGAVIVTTDGIDVFRVDPQTGEATVLDRATGVEGPGSTHELAVRPATGDGQLTVASTVELGGSWNMRVSTWDQDGALVEWTFLGSGLAGNPASTTAPRPVWSEDGRYVYWMESIPTGDVLETRLIGWDAVERPVDGNGVPATFVAGATVEELVEPHTVDLQSWTEGPSGPVLGATRDGRAYLVQLTPVPSSGGPAHDIAMNEIVYEGSTPIDTGRLDSGVELALVVRSSPSQDSEGATLEVVADPMGTHNRLDLPELLPGGTADPFQGWMAVGGDRIVVGTGASVLLATVTGDLAEEVEVTDVVSLPSDTVGAAIWAPPAAPTAEPAPIDTAVPTTPPTPDDIATPIQEEAVEVDGVPTDGLPRYVVSRFNSADTFLLLDRTNPDEPIATWGRPEGVLPEATMANLVVAPDSSLDRVRIVTRWVVGESETMVYTEIVDGQVGANEAFPADRHPANGDPGAWPDSAPVWSPDSTAVAWVENPAAVQGPARVRTIGVTSNGPTGEMTTIPTPEGVSVHRLHDWSFDPDAAGGVLWTFTTRSADGVSSQVAELTITSAGNEWNVRDLPAPVYDVGSFTFDNGAQRYVLLAPPEGGVFYSLIEAPDTAVPTGLAGPSDGRIIAYGPDSLVVQFGDGTFGRVQVDDGATSVAELPPSTVAVLPWNF